MGSNVPTSVASDIKDLALAHRGKLRVDWAFQSMPVLQTIRKQFIRSQALAGMRVAACLHVTTETANLMIALKDGGAQVTLCAANPLSTHDDVAATLVKDHGIATYAIKDAPHELYCQHLMACAETRPHLTMDDGAHLVSLLHTQRSDLLENIVGGTEETTTGVIRLRAMAKAGILKYPIIAVNDACTKHVFDNLHGAAQSTIDGIIRATNVLFAGSSVVVAGYGGCGRGVAARARALGAHVIVTEIDPTRALEAVMDGFRVMTMNEAAQIGDIFIPVTGNKHVMGREAFTRIKNNAIVCNSGRFHGEIGLGEIDLETLGKMAVSRRETRDFVEEYKFGDGRRVYVLGEGRLVHLASAEGHPASVMDISFANQALSAEHLVKHQKSLENKVYPVPEKLDKEVARLKLEAMNVSIDRLTPEQEHYLTTADA
jgi:adenosylhomocysteinase